MTDWRLLTPLHIAMLAFVLVFRLNATHVWAFACITYTYSYLILLFIQFKTIFEFSHWLFSCLTVVRSLLFLTGEWIGLLRLHLTSRRHGIGLDVVCPRPWPRVGPALASNILSSNPSLHPSIVPCRTIHKFTNNLINC